MRKQIQSIKEEKQVPVVPPNKDNSKPTGYKEGDTIKVVKDVGKMDRNTFWRVVGIEGETNGLGTPWHFMVFNKVIPKTGELSNSLMSGSQFLKRKDYELFFNKGYFETMEPGKTYTEGELSIDTIKELISNTGLDKMIGLPMNQVVTSSGSYIKIYYRDTTDSEEIFNKIVKALKSKGIALDKGDEEYKKGRSLLYVKKKQTGG